MSSFQELLEQKKKEAERQKVVRERELKLEAEREEREKAERVKREQAEEERARLQRAAARRKEQDDAEKARKAALAKETLERDRAMNRPSILAKTTKKSTAASSSKVKTTAAPRASGSGYTTPGTKAPVLTREEKRKLREDREFGVAAPNLSGPASGRKKMSEGDRVARMLAAATAGRGLNAKIPERQVVPVRRSEAEQRQRDRDADARTAAAGTANRTGPTYKAHSSIAHQVTSRPIKPLDRVQADARELASANVARDRRSIDVVQREIRGSRAVAEERDFFDGPSRKAGASSSGKKPAPEPRMTGDASLVINKMALDRENRQHPRTNGHGTKSPSTVPSKRRRRSLTPSDDSQEDDDDAAQDFDSDDLDDVDVRRKRKKKQTSSIGAATRRREGVGRPPAGGSVLAAAGLDIYAMFGRKDKAFYLSRDRHSDSEDDMEADAATIRKEEARAARQAREDDRREEAEERRRAEEKRRRKERGR